MTLEHVPLVASAVMLAAFVAEFIFSRLLRHDDYHETRDTLTAVLIAIGYVVFSLVRGVMFTALAFWVYQRMPWHWPSSDPLAILVCFVVVDFFFYWSHRASHAVAFMWAFHAAHHSSTKLNLSTGLRNSWLGGFIDWVFIIPPAFMGFHPVLLAACVAVMSGWDFMSHTPYVGRVRVLDYFFNSPANHRVHHSLREGDQRCNYGGMLFIWDRMFGTYRALPTTPDEYGISPPPARPYNPLYLQFFLLPGFRKWLAPK